MNYAILKLALAPLDRLQGAVDLVRSGGLHARVAQFLYGDRGEQIEFRRTMGDVPAAVDAFTTLAGYAREHGRAAELFDNGMEFFSTFGGNTVSCAI